MAEPVRVLELIVSTAEGGGPAHVRELAARLPRGEFALTVGGPAGGAHERGFREAGVDFVGVRADRLSPRVYREVMALVRDRRIQIVHSHGKGAGLYGRLAARRAGIAAVHTFHGIHYAQYPPGLRALYLALERRLAQTTAAIVHVSESQAREAAALGLAPAGRSRVIPVGVDVARLGREALSRAEARQRLGIPAAPLVVGTVARFDPVKALEVLLRAAALLGSQPDRPELCLIGDGPEAPRLRSLAAALGLGARARFAGLVPGAARLLPAFDLYASASRKEGLPLAILEAMATSLPVVATRVPGHVDAVADGETGLLVPPDDPAALARALGALLADPERRRTLGEAGRRRVEERFDSRRMLEETAALYRELAGRFGAGRRRTFSV